ncbi:methionine aminotransferase [Leeuwenhoekiella marinoflava]|uniref:Methionine aminotransferase n=2 Tax=Leeuwenhoekiella marinoflava TaxID=988 RepID=A0A4Q0PL12_9FLAO|nr:methionine aminotransferase [Leeuwenhoekiella marinoflava]RXG29149.1 methionine aminotransferase [Leeuwenhoekiella marinoflava]SHF33275.1 2-keto-4-methylthiobutyrate aminotransferase apoenzyme [Leeuwenhoekiella marinoflava DSM 3653]
MRSKLPDSKLSIFAVMSKLAADYGALNLSQGFPDFDTDPALIQLVTEAMQAGHNQYAPLAGNLRLREKIAELVQELRGKYYNPESEITLTVGASEALYVAITAFVHRDDEVIVLKPAYDIYEPSILLQGGVPVPVQLEAPYTHINWDAVAAAITPKTRMLIINNPHNPSGMTFQKADLERLEDLVRGTNILILSDEVYEHIVFDNQKHQSVASVPGLAERSLITASFGKTFHTTGWKTGYCLAPKALMHEFKKVHQNTVFCVHHPTQVALATYLEEPRHYLNLSAFYQRKRDVFIEAIAASRFQFTPSAGTYFQMLDYSKITDEPAPAFAERLTKENGLASIPVSVFNVNGKDDQLLRFCFAKEEATLLKAASILNSI